MKIDSHQHFWNYNSFRDNWIDETMMIIRKNFLPKDLKPILYKNNIDGCIVVQADQSEEETIFLLKCAEENPFIKGVIGWVDLCANNVEERLDYFFKNKLFKGVRHILQGENVDFMLRTDFQNGISKLQQFNLTYDVLISSSQLATVIELVKKFPNQLFVIDHIAKPEIKERKIDFWKINIEKIAKYPNVYCKISGMVIEANLQNWKKEDIIPYLDVVFEAFGTNRLMYGSDWPVCLLAASYKQQLSIVERYILQFSDSEQALIMGNNAVAFYNINDKLKKV